MLTELGRTRLQLRWVDAPPNVRQKYGEGSWLCFYELSFPLAEFDPRAYDEDGSRVRDEHVVEMGPPQLRMGHPDNVPGRDAKTGDYRFEIPFRIRMEVLQDSEALRLPLVVVALDGTIIERPEGWSP